MKAVLVVLMIVTGVMAGLFLAYGTYNKFHNTDIKSLGSPAQKEAQSAPVKKEDPAKRKAAWQLLKNGVAGELRDFRGIAAVVIKDLGKNWEINSNADLRIASASMVKIPIMAAYIYAAREGKIDLKSMVQIRKSDFTPGSGELKFESPGREFPVEDLIVLMVTESDNTAANMLIEKMGFDTVNMYFKKIGLKFTNLSRKMMDFKERKEGVENYTTASDMACLLEKMYRGKFIDPAASKQCLEILACQQVNDRIPKKLPAGIVVAHKTGLENGLCHDAGIVYAPNGNYLICVLTKHRNKTAKETKSLIADISLLVYNYYGNF